MKIIFSLFIFMIQVFSLLAQPAKVSTGSIQHFQQFASKYIVPRNVDVWLPDGYSNKKKYAVLYMHDGQMLFNSSTTWNHEAWLVDATAAKLMQEKKVNDFIVVGIWNGGADRHPDYFPQKPFEALTAQQQDVIYKTNNSNGQPLFNGKIHSDNYLKFLVLELKPFIDSKFSVKKGAANTFIAGSSMGGLISMYAICEYPSVFGGAACLSTHWPGIFTTVNNPIPAAFQAYLKSHLPNPATHKLYFDHGTTTLDSMYAPYQLQANEITHSGGYTDRNFMTKVFKGEAHTEKAWAKRLNIPLLFLLKK